MRKKSMVCRTLLIFCMFLLFESLLLLPIGFRRAKSQVNSITELAARDQEKEKQLNLNGKSKV